MNHFNIGDIFSKYYKTIRFKRYFLVADEPYECPDGTYTYDVIDLEDGTNLTFNINHKVKDKMYPIKKEA